MRRTIAMLLLAAAMAVPACDRDDPVSTASIQKPCAPGQRRVLFRLDNRTDISRCVQVDTLLAATSPSCTLMVWIAPNNHRYDEWLRYEVSATDTTAPCGTAYFFAVVQNSAGGYTYFDGQVRRSFGTGAGPFATGVYEISNYQQTLVGIGYFEFWE
jgi:hypothetical protein